MKKLILTILVAVLPLTGQADTLFTEGFESPAVTGYDDKTISLQWVGSNDGFGSDRKGLDEKSSGNWTTNATSGDQVFSFKYTNTGLTTKDKEIGTIDLFYAKYTVTIEYCADRNVSPQSYTSLTGTAYDVAFWAISPLDTERNHVRTYDDGLDNSTLLAREVSDVSTNGVFETITLTYTTDPILDAGSENFDLAIRLKGQTACASADNITVTATISGGDGKPIVIAGRMVTSGGSPLANPADYWTPSQIDTEAWLDASTTASIGFGTGDRVSTWYDKSGNGNDAVQGSGSLQPSFNTSDSLLNNLPTIGYDQARRFLAIPTITIQNVYVVTYFSQLPTTFRMLFGNGNANSEAAQSKSGGAWEGKGIFVDEDFYGNGGTTPIGGVIPAMPFTASVWKFKGSGQTTDIFWLLGGKQTYHYWSYGAIGEVIFTDGTEDLATQQKVEGYLAWKWGIEASLASDHPYKNRRP